MASGIISLITSKLSKLSRSPSPSFPGGGTPPGPPRWRSAPEAMATGTGRLLRDLDDVRHSRRCLVSHVVDLDRDGLAFNLDKSPRYVIFQEFLPGHSRTCSLRNTCPENGLSTGLIKPRHLKKAKFLFPISDIKLDWHAFHFTASGKRTTNKNRAHPLCTL